MFWEVDRILIYHFFFCLFGNLVSSGPGPLYNPPIITSQSNITPMKRKRSTADTVPTDMPKNIRKYWYRRYDMFRRFDEGIKLSNEMWFSVTPEAIALYATTLAKSYW